ncbi:MAG: PEP-CTERM sorting domain-containing protein [Sedimentisphaerales bacterium]|nr:PEP-CTERM sorting domain-containing protein [Sedimentisphaerales bacterium]
MPISSVPAGGLVVGDKLFSDFLVDGIAQGGALTPTASTVYIQGGKDDVSGNYGLKFLLDWDAGSNQSICVNIDYKVSILPGYDEYFIDGAWSLLSLAGATGTGVVAATETMWDAPLPFGSWLATLSTSWQVGASGLDLKDYANFAQIKQMWVNNGFTVTGGLSGTAKLNEVFQMYTQIPEPATLLLLGLGSLALIRIRKR